MNAALIWIALPLLVSLLIILIRANYRLSCWIQIASSFSLALIAMLSFVDPVEKTGIRIIEIAPIFNILGRSLIIDENLKNFIAILYSFLCVWTIALYIFNVKSRIVPLGLAFLAFAITSLAVEPFLYSALLIELAVIVSAIMVADSNSPSKSGILRYLIYFSMGVPFILLAGWYLAGGEITPVNEEQLIQATLLLGLGFVFWLGVFPFHSWMAPMADENRPSESMFLLIIMPIVVVMLLLKYLNGFVWLREYDVVFRAIRIFGLIMVLTGSAWAYFQQKINRLISYLMIVSIGSTLLSISIGLPAGIYITSFLFFVRISSFFPLAWALFILKREKNNISLNSLEGLFYSSPFLATTTLIAFFSIAGMPFTLGFPVMQSLYAYLAASDQLVLITLIFSMSLISLTFIRISFLFFSKSQAIIQNTFSLSQFEKSLFFILFIFIILISLMPGFSLTGFESTVKGFEFLVK